MTALQKLTRYIKDYGSEASEDFAAVQEAMGGICLKQGRSSKASEHFKEATGIYGTIWEDSPEQVEVKCQEIGELYPQAEIGLAQKLLSQKSYKDYHRQTKRWLYFEPSFCLSFYILTVHLSLQKSFLKTVKIHSIPGQRAFLPFPAFCHCSCRFPPCTGYSCSNTFPISSLIQMDFFRISSGA
ncbi:MAG: hypothetical protein LUE61_09515 [Clostridiales bacterium]|nr:hypothetical protein [Clostridiales bacterium]